MRGSKDEHAWRRVSREAAEATVQCRSGEACGAPSFLLIERQRKRLLSLVSAASQLDSKAMVGPAPWPPGRAAPGKRLKGLSTSTYSSRKWDDNNIVLTGCFRTRWRKAWTAPLLTPVPRGLMAPGQKPSACTSVGGAFFLLGPGQT